MKISEVLREKDRGVSFELFPPKTGEGRSQLMDVVRELSVHSPLYVSVTYGAGGSTQDRTMDTLKMLKGETDLNLMSHLTCIGATREGMDAILREYMGQGIDNILALRGDPPHDMYEVDRMAGEFTYARDLVAFVKSYGYFSIGVAVYPEGHQESPSLEKDMDYTKQKIDEGADFGITQMFFDNSYLYGFMERALARGITVPILPGIMPITDFEKVRKFASFCGATIPAEIEKEMAGVLDRPEEMFKKGVEIAVRQCRDLMANGVRHLHFYTLNKSGAVGEILKGLGL
jgi:methylenetetrahydrofolate reductase (NADPH)